MNSKKLAIATFLAAGGAFAVGAFYYQNQTSKQTTQAVQDNSKSLVRPHSPVLGNAQAKVTLVEFFDPSCETCRAFYPIVKGIIRSSFGEVKLVLRYAPLHQGSDIAVKIIEAARQQDLYWPVLDRVIETQPIWAAHSGPDPERIWDLVRDTGLDIARAKKAMQDPAIEQALLQDMADMAALKIAGTPSFFVNGKPLPRFGVDELQAQVKAELLNIQKK